MHHKHTLTRIRVIVFLSDYFSRIAVLVCQKGGFSDDDDDDDDDEKFLRILVQNIKSNNQHYQEKPF